MPSIEDTWEYPINLETLESNIDAPIITINFVKDEEVLKSITMRYGKRLPSGLMSNIAIGSSQIYVSKTSLITQHITKQMVYITIKEHVAGIILLLSLMTL